MNLRRLGGNGVKHKKSEGATRVEHLHFLHVDENEEGHGKLLMPWEMMMEEVILFSFFSQGATFLELSSCSTCHMLFCRGVSLLA